MRSISSAARRHPPAHGRPSSPARPERDDSRGPRLVAVAPSWRTRRIGARRGVWGGGRPHECILLAAPGPGRGHRRRARRNRRRGDLLTANNGVGRVPTAVRARRGPRSVSPRELVPSPIRRRCGDRGLHGQFATRRANLLDGNDLVHRATPEERHRVLVHGGREELRRVRCRLVPLEYRDPDRRPRRVLVPGYLADGPPGAGGARGRHPLLRRQAPRPGLLRRGPTVGDQRSPAVPRSPPLRESGRLHERVRGLGAPERDRRGDGRGDPQALPGRGGADQLRHRGPTGDGLDDRRRGDGAAAAIGGDHVRRR